MKLYVVTESHAARHRSAHTRSGADSVIGVYEDHKTAVAVASVTTLRPHLEREQTWRQVTEVDLDRVWDADLEEMDRQGRPLPLGVPL